jgi:transketolase C-terminal domain/subunit
MALVKEAAAKTVTSSADAGAIDKIVTAIAKQTSKTWLRMSEKCGIVLPLFL